MACSKKQKINSEILNIPIEATIARFDQEFMQVTPDNFSSLKQKYPYLLAEHIDDSVWFQKKNDSLFQELYSETQTKFSDLSTLTDELTLLFKHIKYYFPNENPGKVVTVLSEVDIMNRAIYADTISIISLDTYLGKDHEFYVDFDTYKEMLLPEKREALLMNYTNDQLNWAKANEAQVWKYFIENKYLYDNDMKLTARFIQRAPFSKFYLELDHESPGSVGVYIGWQIVRSFMENNNVTLQELALKDAKTIFDQSKYKPKK